MGATNEAVSRRRGGVGSHERTNEGATNEWYTPPGIFTALRLRFDLDPCSPPGGLPWVPADRFLTADDDGLLTPWSGRVWLNPPYGRLTAPFLRKLADHGSGVALVFARTDTRWWHEVVPRADAVCLIAGRLSFVPSHGGPTPSNAGAPSALIAFGPECAEAVRLSRLGMTFPVGAQQHG